MLTTGPWRHEFLRARGSRFHLARAGPPPASAPLVLLLPDVGRSWWSWRLVLAGLGGAGVPAAALDPRGVGASDKTPTGYHPADVLADTAAVLAAVGAPAVVAVGHGWGGRQAAELAAAAPDTVRAVVGVAAPAPGALQGYRCLRLAALLGTRVLPPARLRRRSGWAEHPPSAPCVLGLSEWPGPQRALAPLRASALRRARSEKLSGVDDVHVRGSLDPLLPHPRRGVEQVTVLDGGHQLPEERADELTALLQQVHAGTV